MPTPEENMQSVRTFAEEVIGNKNLKLRTTGSLRISSNMKCSCLNCPTRSVQSTPIASSSRHRPT